MDRENEWSKGIGHYKSTKKEVELNGFFCKPLNNKSGSPVRAAALFFLYV